MDKTTPIQIHSLSKTFKRGKFETQAVKNINLEVDAGQVFGFLGPNGAGKTTTIRMLMDLIQPTQGQVHLFGEPVRNNPQALQRAGALVEGPAFYGYMNAYDNLAVLARTANHYDPKAIKARLKQVGLENKTDQPVSNYSLGMKQRLGIAAALLNDPDLLILDEPTNGLDPAGIQEIRAFIRSLAEEQGKTVFVSSHLLNEVEQICDRVAIIYQGEIVRRGVVSELLSGSQQELRIQATPIERALQILQAEHPVKQEEQWLKVIAKSEDSSKIVKQLVNQNINVHQVVVHRQSLEDYFLTVTQDQHGETDNA